jgi:hypothetical protein
LLDSNNFTSANRDAVNANVERLSSRSFHFHYASGVQLHQVADPKWNASNFNTNPKWDVMNEIQLAEHFLPSQYNGVGILGHGRITIEWSGTSKASSSSSLRDGSVAEGF